MSKPQPAPDTMSREEWQARCDLAACYQLVDLYGWSDLSSTHISARIPGTDDLLFNPYGVLFDQITASSLVRVDAGGDGNINPAGFLIHRAIHDARPDVHCVLHTHTRAGNAVAMQETGLLPLTQKALILMGWIAYHDFEGVVLDADEQERLVGDLGDNMILVLRNHGLLTCGESIGSAFVWMHRMEAACRYQIDGMAGGAALRYPSLDVQNKTIEQGRLILGSKGRARSGMEWSSLMTQLERVRGSDWRT